MNKNKRADKNWEDYTNDVIESPKSALGVFIKGSLVLIIVGIMFSGIGMVTGWFGEAATVARQEFGPKAMLTKYEWFKDTAAGLDRKQANITVYSTRLAVFDGMSRKDMDRTDKTQQAQWLAEVAGVKASYNMLASDWNSQISKFHWKPFLGDLPPGAETLLTKEYAPYETQ